MRPHVLCRPWNFPASIVEWLPSPFSGILPTQESNPGLLQFRPIVYQVSHGFFFCFLFFVFLVFFFVFFNPRKQWHPTPVLLSGKFYGWSSLVGCSPWGRKESDTTERLHFHFHALEKEMAPRSSVLAWRIPETGEPGGPPSVRSHRVRHD